MTAARARAAGGQRAQRFSVSDAERVTAAVPPVGVKRTAIASRTDLRPCSSRAALGVKRMRTRALPLAPTVTAG